MKAVSFKYHYTFQLQEHKCVLDSCRALEAEGFEISYLPVQANGIIDMKVRLSLI